MAPHAKTCRRCMPPRSRSPFERFERLVDKTETCWTWLGNVSPEGYGRFGFRGRTDQAHRVAFELYMGPIAPDLVIDHLCRNRRCVNPAHLDPVSTAENVKRATSLEVLGTCKRGHPATPENVYIRGNGQRMCRPCSLERNRRWYADRRAS